MSTLLNSVNQLAPSPPSSPPAVAAGGSEGERSEPERTPAATAGGREAPDPEVVGRPVRRRFTAEYKGRVLAEVDRATGRGANTLILLVHPAGLEPATF